MVFIVLSLGCARATLREGDAGLDLFGDDPSNASGDEDGADDGLAPEPDGGSAATDGGDGGPVAPGDGDGNADGIEPEPGGDDGSTEPPPAETIRGVVFSEVMPRPTGSSAAEWIELYNTTDEDVDLAGCTIANGSLIPTSFGITSALVVPKRGFVVLAREDANTKSGLTPSYVYGELSMGSSETLRLECAGTMVDEVSYEGAEYQASLQLDARYAALGQNDDASTWCLGTTALPTGDDLGTPGAANVECADVAAP